MNSHEELKGKLMEVTVFLPDFNLWRKWGKMCAHFLSDSHHEAEVIYFNLPLIQPESLPLSFYAEMVSFIFGFLFSSFSFLIAVVCIHI